MFSIGNYTFLIVKKEDKKPADLHKAEKSSNKEQIYEIINKHNTKINIILIIVLLILFLLLCNMAVPQTYRLLPLVKT